MKYLIVLLFLVFSFGQLDRISIRGNEVVLHINDLAVLVFLLFALRKISCPLIKPLLFFLFAIILSLLLNFKHFKPFELLVASLYPIRFFLYAGLYFAVKNLSAENKKLTQRWLFLAIVIVAITGLLQYIFLPNVAFLSAFDWDDHYYRLIGLFLDPGFTGIILVLGLIMAFPKKIMLLFYAAIVLTYSRASFLAFLVSMAVYKKFLIAALVLILTLPILPKAPSEGTNLNRENSTWARINNWRMTLNIWKTSPIFGVGFDTYRYVQKIDSNSHSGAGADSSILLVLATSGLLGLLAYTSLLLTMWRLGRHNLVFAAGFLAILVHSFFNNTLFYPWVMEWLWILLALSSSDSQPDQKPQS